MILDERGVVISRVGPDLEVIKKDMSSRGGDYSEFPWMIAPSSMGSMSYKLLRNVYNLSSAVRPAVDSIAREISTLPWKVINKDYKFHPPAEMADIIDFFEVPNYDAEDLPIILTKALTDFLVVGKLVIEKVRTPTGKLTELVTRDASLFQPELNSMGMITGYKEFKRDTFIVKKIHKKENIIYRHFTPLSYTYGSCPIIETIVNEVALLMLSVKAIAWAFTRDEIPPGILVLGEIGSEALDRAKASFEATKGIVGANKLRVVDNVKEANWVQFTRPFREMQVAELMPMIERIVARNFGLSPVESSLSDVARGVAESSFKSSQSKLVFPLMTVIGSALNHEIVWEFNRKAIFIWSRTPQEDFNDRASGLGQLVDRGVITDNEARLPLGFDPVPGGDTRSVKLGNERVPLDPKTGEPKYRNPVNPGQALHPQPGKAPAKKDIDNEPEES